MTTALARSLVAFVLLAAVAAPAVAAEDPAVQEREQQKKDAEALEKQYKATLKNTDSAPAPARADPWQNMRGPDDSKTKR